MPTIKKPKTTSQPFNTTEIAAAKAAASSRSARGPGINWNKGVVTRGGGVAATIDALRRTRGPGKKPTKEQVALRLDQEIVGAFRAGGPGWQTRMNTALKEWLATQPVRGRTRKLGGIRVD